MKTSKGIQEKLTDVETLMKDSDSSSFARLMNLKTAKAERGYCLAKLTISKDKHLNFGGTTHGAVLFAIADHACGLCANSLGRKAVLLNSNINMLANPKPGKVVEAEARMIHTDEKKGILNIDVKDSEGKIFARCQSIVYFLT
ncbi:MAG: PaaI family thioesterase [Desulfobacterales bacterium]|nr:MAG: PaaI family thioesterase [Desulfobacterales bacterium]